MNKTPTPITAVTLENELDLVLAYKKAMKLAEVSGLSFTDQTKFTTAVSEICRNVLVHADKGRVKFYITQQGPEYMIEAVVTDQGPGIADVDALLSTLNSKRGQRKSGVINSQKLSDIFEINPHQGGGTQVRIGKSLPANHPPINALILSGWQKFFSELAPISPYDELKKQNHRLLQTLEELKNQKEQTQEKLEEIQDLNRQLASNYEQIKKLSEDAENQNQLLKKRNEELDGFAYIVSHDLKAPIANLQGLLELLKTDPRDQVEIIRLFGDQLAKMDQLISSILSYSLAGHGQVEKQEVNVHQLVEELIKDLQRPGDFTIDTEGTLPTMFTEQIFVFQIFSNLLTNAIKYNDKSAGWVKIGYVSTSDGQWYFYVEDNGPGIAEAKREVVFNMFTILKKVKGVNSTGLGLAIIKKIIVERGGKIWVQDPAFFKTGSRFCFTWPAEVVAQPT